MPGPRRSRMRAAHAATAVAAAAVLACAPPAAASASASPGTRTQRAHRAGVEAYVHAYPPLVNRLSQASFPVNTLVGIASPARAEDRLIVMPNVDTAYTAGRLDLRAGPLVVHVPAMPGRYHELQLMDAYTSVAGYVGTRTTGDGAGDYAIAGPGFHGHLPPGLRALRSPTDDALLLGRTLIRPTDAPLTLAALLGQYALTPLSALTQGGTPLASVVLPVNPNRARPVLPKGLALLDAFNRILADDPPSRAEAKALAPLRRYGIGPGLQASKGLPTAVRRALARGVDDGPAHLAAIAEARRRRAVRDHAGWAVPDRRTGDAGSDWTLRALVATYGLWANTPAEAAYPSAADDSRGRPLTGAHRYALTFRGPVPARAFWSLTMYDTKGRLYPNPLRRHAVGDRSPGLRAHAGGSLTIALQHRRPRGGSANWLPAPAGRFKVSLRLYIPARSVLDGQWSPPGIACLDCRAR